MKHRSIGSVNDLVLSPDESMIAVIFNNFLDLRNTKDGNIIKNIGN